MFSPMSWYLKAMSLVNPSCSINFNVHFSCSGVDLFSRVIKLVNSFIIASFGDPSTETCLGLIPYCKLVNITWDPTSVGEENETFFIRVWKPLPSRRVLKPWGLRWYVTGQSGQYLLAVGLSCYKWYQIHTLSDVPAKRLSPEGGEHETVCQQGCWLQRGVD